MAESTRGSHSDRVTTSSDFNETLPCFEDTSLQEDVKDLQTAYARIDHEETSQFETNDTGTARYDVKDNIAEESSTSKKQDNSNENRNKERCARRKSQSISSEQDLNKSDSKVSHPSRDYLNKKRPSSTRSNKDRHVDTPRVRNESDKLRSSFPTKVEHHGRGRNEKYAEGKSRRISEPAIGTASEITTETYTDGRDSLEIPEFDRKGRSSLPKREKIYYTQKREKRGKREHSHTSECGSTLEQFTVTDKDKTLQVTRDPSAIINRRDDILIQQKLPVCQTSNQVQTEIPRIGENTRDTRSLSFSNDMNTTSIAKAIENMSDLSQHTTCLKGYRTAPINLPSRHSVVEENSGEQKASSEGIVASDTYNSVCTKCKTKGKDTPAISYCLNCADFLCHRCLRRHDSNKLKKDHEIWRGNAMPGSFTVQQFEIERKLNEKCSQHTNRNIKCFCLDHNVLCCTVCKTSDHASCRQQSLDKLLIHTPDIRKLKLETSRASTKMFNSLLKVHQVLKANAKCSNKEQDTIIEEVKTRSKIVIENIKKLEEQFIDHVRKTFEEEKSESDKDIKECEKYISIVSKDIQYLDEPKGKKESKLKTVEKVKQIEMLKLPECLQNQLIKDEIDKRKPQKYKVNTEFDRITEMRSFGELVPIDSNQLNLSRTTDTENSSCTAEDDLLEEQAGKSVTNCEIISGWSKGDFVSSTCFTAIELLDNGSVLLSDQKNVKLKLLDSDLSLLKSMGVSSEPWGISKLRENKYIVTLPSETSYQEVDVTGKDLNLCRKIDLGIECTCVIQTKNRLLFSGIDVDEPKLIFTDLDGKTKDSLLSVDQLKLFKRPNHLLKSLADENIVFVSDVDEGVFAIDIEKKNILFQYTHRTMKCAMGMTMTEKGHILICSQQTHSLHCITKEGQYLFSVSVDNIHDMRGPQCICYLPHSNEFLTTSDKNYNIVKFKLN